MTDVDIDQALQAVEELMDSGAAPTKPEKPKKPAGYDVYASPKSAADGKADSRVDSLEKLLNKIGESASSGADLVSLTVHYVRPFGSVVAVSSARPPAKSAVKLMAKMAGKSDLSVMGKEAGEKVGTFMLSKKKFAGVEKKPKIKKEKKSAAPKKPSAKSSKSDETPQARIEANLKKLQKKQKEKAV